MPNPQTPTPTIYFAYGSNLWLHQMATRCPQSHYIGIARLENHKWIINQRGYANIVEVPPSTPSTRTTPSNSKNNKNKSNESSSSTSSTTAVTAPPSVYALVYTLSPTDESRLDTYEGVPHAYTKAHLPCTFWPSTADRKVDTRLPPAETGKEMLVYIDRMRTAEGRPREEYVERMNCGIGDAGRLGVPMGYVEGVLRRFVPRGEGEVEGGQEEEEEEEGGK